MDGTHVYAKAGYQMTGGRGSAPSWEHASAPALFFIRWIIDRDLLNAAFVEQHGSPLVEYRQGALTLFEFFENTCDLDFDSEMLSVEGNAFAGSYFDYDSGRYIGDLWTLLNLGKHDHPLYTEVSYSRLKPLIDSRYDKWKKGDVEAVRLPPEKQTTKWSKQILGVLIFIGILICAYVLIWALNGLLYPRS